MSACDSTVSVAQHRLIRPSPGLLTPIKRRRSKGLATPRPSFPSHALALSGPEAACTLPETLGLALAPDARASGECVRPGKARSPLSLLHGRVCFPPAALRSPRRPHTPPARLTLRPTGRSSSSSRRVSEPVDGQRLQTDQEQHERYPLRDLLIRQSDVPFEVPTMVRYPGQSP